MSDKKNAKYSSEAIEEVALHLQEGLRLFNGNLLEADDVVGDPPPDAHVTLVKAVRAGTSMLYRVMMQFGLRKSKKSIREFTRMQAVLLTLVHYAFAAGILEGKRRSEIDKKPCA